MLLSGCAIGSETAMNSKCALEIAPSLYSRKRMSVYAELLSWMKQLITRVVDQQRDGLTGNQREITNGCRDIFVHN